MFLSSLVIIGIDVDAKGLNVLEMEQQPIYLFPRPWSSARAEHTRSLSSAFNRAKANMAEKKLHASNQHFRLQSLSSPIYLQSPSIPVIPIPASHPPFSHSHIARISRVH